MGQPRAIVFHEKEGREHCHVVWSRVDLDRMKAVQISHDHMKLRTCSRELAHAYGLRLPDGLAEDRGDARFEKTPDMTRAEQEMAVASGLEPKQRREEITALYRSSDNAESFRAGLERAGYVLAQGDRRSYVVVDRAGDVHALARQIDDVRTKAVKERLATIPAETLPTVDIARAQQQSRQRAVDERLREKARERGAKSARDLAAKQVARRRKLIDLRRQQLSVTHASERMMLRAAHKAEQDRIFNRVAGRIFALFDKVPALRSVIAPLRANPAINPGERHRIENEALNRRHARERRNIDRRSVALDKIEARERRGLIRALVRDTRVEDVQRQARTDQRERDFRTAAVDVTAPTATTPTRTTADDRRAQARLRIEQVRQLMQDSRPLSI